MDWKKLWRLIKRQPSESSADPFLESPDPIETYLPESNSEPTPSSPPLTKQEPAGITLPVREDLTSNPSFTGECLEVFGNKHLPCALMDVGYTILLVFFRLDDQPFVPFVKGMKYTWSYIPGTRKLKEVISCEANS